MSRKDVPDVLVLLAYNYRRQYEVNAFPYEILMGWTGQPEKVCYAAMERACDHNLIEYGVSLRTGWLTEKGKDLLKTESSKFEGGDVPSNNSNS